MSKPKKYDFSFTGFSLRVNDMFRYAEGHAQGIEFTKPQFGDGNTNTGQRRLVEIKKRLNSFTQPQLELFLKTDLTSQRNLAFLSVCKVHLFLHEFAVEVLREKVLVFDYQLTEGDYLSFYRRKAELYPELEELSEITQNKIRQVTFKILEEAGIIDSVKSRVIQPQFILDEVKKVIIQENPQLLKVFLLSDVDIEYAIDS